MRMMKPVKAVFVELPPFERYRAVYLDGRALASLQEALLADPQAKAGRQFWLFTIYGKDEIDDLTAAQRKALRGLLDHEVAPRRKQ